MTVGIYTTELTAENSRLMPWRTLMEVARRAPLQGVRVVVISGGCRVCEEMLDGVRVIHLERPRMAAARREADARLAEEKVERLYFPIAPGPVNRWALGLQRRLGVCLVWYMPGAWYSVRQVAVAMRYLGVRPTFPYVVQALWPKRWWVRGLLCRGARPLVVMTAFTTDQLAEAGYPRGRICVIPPGRDEKAAARGSTEAFERLRSDIGQHPYFLFFGPPNPIRGVIQLIAAFRALAAEVPECRLVCLFRADGNVDALQIRRLVEDSGLQGHLFAVWDSVSHAELDAFLQHCRAVVKPFLLVPSEIPLAVIETAQYGKPVIGFGGDGTGAFIEQIGVSVRHGDARALALAMTRLMQDDTFYAERCAAAAQTYQAHPTWDQVAQRWWAAGEGP